MFFPRLSLFTIQTESNWLRRVFKNTSSPSVTEVGDHLCWWQTTYVGDHLCLRKLIRFYYQYVLFCKKHQKYFINTCQQNIWFVTNSVVTDTMKLALCRQLNFFSSKYFHSICSIGCPKNSNSNLYSSVVSMCLFPSTRWISEIISLYDLITYA